MIIRVQGPAQGISATSPVVVTLASIPINGNVLIATIGGYGSTLTVASVTQVGVTWAKAEGMSAIEYYGMDSEIWYGIVKSLTASTIISIAYSSGFLDGIVDVCEYSGLLTVGVLDKTATYGGTATTTETTGTIATSADKELLIASIFIVASGITPNEFSPTNSFALLDGVGWSSFVEGFLERMVTATGSYSTGTTSTGGYTHMGYVTCIASFKAQLIIERFQEEGSDFRETKFGAIWS